VTIERVQMPLSNDALGIRFDLEADLYHRRELGVVSKSALDLFQRSPAHYKAWIDGHDRKETDALRFGQAMHVALLEPERFSDTYIVEPDFGDCRGKANRAARDAWRESNANRVVVSNDNQSSITAMQRSFFAHPTASKLLHGGISEVSLRWVDDETGVVCKARADRWNPDRKLAVDLKSTDDASPEGFAKSVAKWRYHVQDALYRAGFAACGEPVEHFALVAIEKEPPYAVAVYTLDTEAVAKGHSLARAGIEMMRVCLDTKSWVAYSNGVSELALPRWAS